MIREAVADDFGCVALLMRHCHEEAAFKMPQLNLEKSFHRFTECIEHGCAFVAEVSGTIVGCFLGQRGTLWFSDEPYAMEVFTYVFALRRNTGAGTKLYKAFRDWAKTKGLKVVLANSCGTNTDRFETLFTRMGLTKIGSQFIEV